MVRPGVNSAGQSNLRGQGYTPPSAPNTPSSSGGGGSGGVSVPLVGQDKMGYPSATTTNPYRQDVPSVQSTEKASGVGYHPEIAYDYNTQIQAGLAMQNNPQSIRNMSAQQATEHLNTPLTASYASKTTMYMTPLEIQAKQSTPLELLQQQQYNLNPATGGVKGMAPAGERVNDSWGKEGRPTPMVTTYSSAPLTVNGVDYRGEAAKIKRWQMNQPGYDQKQENNIQDSIIHAVYGNGNKPKGSYTTVTEGGLSQEAYDKLAPMGVLNADIKPGSGGKQTNFTSNQAAQRYLENRTLQQETMSKLQKPIETLNQTITTPEKIKNSPIKVGEDGILAITPTKDGYNYYETTTITEKQTIPNTGIDLKYGMGIAIGAASELTKGAGLTGNVLLGSAGIIKGAVATAIGDTAEKAYTTAYDAYKEKVLGLTDVLPKSIAEPIAATALTLGGPITYYPRKAIWKEALQLAGASEKDASSYVEKEFGYEGIRTDTSSKEAAGAIVNVAAFSGVWGIGTKAIGSLSDKLGLRPIEMLNQATTYKSPPKEEIISTTSDTYKGIGTNPKTENFIPKNGQSLYQASKVSPLTPKYSSFEIIQEEGNIASIKPKLIETKIGGIETTLEGGPTIGKDVGIVKYPTKVSGYIQETNDFLPSGQFEKLEQNYITKSENIAGPTTEKNFNIIGDKILSKTTTKIQTQELTDISSNIDGNINHASRIERVVSQTSSPLSGISVKTKNINEAFLKSGNFETDISKITGKSLESITKSASKINIEGFSYEKPKLFRGEYGAKTEFKGGTFSEVANLKQINPETSYILRSGKGVIGGFNEPVATVEYVKTSKFLPEPQIEMGYKGVKPTKGERPLTSLNDVFAKNKPVSETIEAKVETIVSRSNPINYMSGKLASETSRGYRVVSWENTPEYSSGVGLTRNGEVVYNENLLTQGGTLKGKPSVAEMIARPGAGKTSSIINSLDSWKPPRGVILFSPVRNDNQLKSSMDRYFKVSDNNNQNIQKQNQNTKQMLFYSQRQQPYQRTNQIMSQIQGSSQRQIIAQKQNQILDTKTNLVNNLINTGARVPIIPTVTTSIRIDNNGGYNGPPPETSSLFKTPPGGGMVGGGGGGGWRRFRFKKQREVKLGVNAAELIGKELGIGKGKSSKNMFSFLPKMAKQRKRRKK